MAPLLWNDSYVIDDGQLDQQHKQWIDIYNTLDQQLSSSSNSVFNNIKLQTLTSMQEYALYHFRFEENLMRNIGFPDLPQHWRMHKNFDYLIFKYIRQIEQNEVVLISDLLSAIHGWLIDHILLEDMRIKAYLDRDKQIDSFEFQDGVSHTT